MLYKYSPEVEKKFKEVEQYINVDLKKSAEIYLKIAKEYEADEAVQAKAYYGAANVFNLLSDMENSEKYCHLCIETGKNSGNIRCQILGIIQLALLKLNQMNDALAADYLFDAYSLAIENKDEDLFNTIFTLLAQIFEAAESYDIALEYHERGIQEFAKNHKEALTTYLSTYGARILCKSICCISAGNINEFKRLYQKLVELHFAETMPIYKVSMIFLEGYWHHVEGNREKAVEVLLHFIDELSKVEEIMDTYELLTHTYNLFEEYHLIECQKKTLELMQHYASIIDVWKCRAQCNQLELRYYKEVNDKEALFEAYAKYHELQLEYSSDHMKQRRANLALRKHLFEEEEEIRKKISDLEEISERDQLTGLLNRNGLIKYRQNTFDTAIARKELVGVALIDVDKYKDYNDIYGHLQGDECLKQVGTILKEVFGEHVCARYGGDEFICLFRGIEKSKIYEYLDKINRTLQEYAMEHKGNDPYHIVTLSQGAVVRKAKTSDTFESLMAEADKNLYKSKAKGRNTIEIN